ncbi:hypothetical protein ABMA27_000030 [Loxostege sticticalis]|uniref:N-acetyltransferase domain-containing protein n=1 Tax=Loxostege sticticalis TaxID=481309 RepID=A0ABR3ILV6_LOXSC
MEWVISVNEMLKDSNNITKLNYTLIPPGFQGDVRSVRVMQESLSKLIDALGEQSAAAQGLNKVITTAEKLRNSPTHTLYLLKDPSGKGGRGEVIGMLKVGRKHLFLFDEHDKVCEVEPLCVLDFFVLRDRQRHGYGQLLFDHMLEVPAPTAQGLLHSVRWSRSACWTSSCCATGSGTATGSCCSTTCSRTPALQQQSWPSTVPRRRWSSSWRGTTASSG